MPIYWYQAFVAGGNLWQLQLWRNILNNILLGERKLWRQQKWLGLVVRVRSRFFGSTRHPNLVIINFPNFRELGL